MSVAGTIGAYRSRQPEWLKNRGISKVVAHCVVTGGTATHTTYAMTMDYVPVTDNDLFDQSVVFSYLCEPNEGSDETPYIVWFSDDCPTPMEDRVHYPCTAEGVKL